MAMNVKPIPTLDERINDIRMRTAEIVNERILPNEAQALARSAATARSTDARPQGVDRAARGDQGEVVKKAGLWAPHLPQEYGGMGLDFLAHAYMNEVLAYARRCRRRCSASSRPNSGNQTILVKYGTEEQKQQVAAARSSTGRWSRASR